MSDARQLQRRGWGFPAGLACSQVLCSRGTGSLGPFLLSALACEASTPPSSVLGPARMHGPAHHRLLSFFLLPLC